MVNADYKERFLRSLGILTEQQLEIIKSKTIAVAGLGLGGSVFINLVRMGFEKFNVADPDTFERTNINRQRLAKETTLYLRKDKCAFDEAKSINPSALVRTFKDGVKAHNVDEFLRGADWVVDVVDVFALTDKMLLHEKARKKGIPVLSCATLGFAGCAVVFDSTTPSFAELTGMSLELSQEQNLKNFIQFIAPEIPDYMYEQLMRAMDQSTYIPFVVPGGEISAAFGTTEMVKNILGIGNKILAPKGIFADAFKSRVEHFKASYKERTLAPPRLKIQKRAA